MNRGFVIIALFLAATILQVSFIPAVFPAAVHADLNAMLVIAVVILLGFERNIQWFIIGGLMCDVLGYWTLGRNVLVMILIGYLASFFSRRFLVGGRGLGFLILVLLVAFAMLIGFLVDLTPHFNREQFVWGMTYQPWLIGTLGSLVLDLFMLGLVFVFLRKIMKYLAPESSKLAIK